MTLDTIPLGQYLFERLQQDPFNVKTVFGVAGDFNLLLLDQLNASGANLRWAGNANELNAAYAADGYSRTMQALRKESTGGLGAIVTTFGVGELSAMNGLAGSFAENVGVLHIAGTPPTVAQEKGLMLHHSLGDGDFEAFARMSSTISCAVALLKDKQSAADEIDRIIAQAYINRRPAYLGFPVDLVEYPVPVSRLKIPISLPRAKIVASTAAQYIIDELKLAKNPLVLLDALCVRQDASKEAIDFVRSANIKYMTMPMSKGGKGVDETLAQFAGTCLGKASDSRVHKIVSDSDLVLWLGPFKSDGNMGFNTTKFDFPRVIEVFPEKTVGKDREFREPMKSVISAATSLAKQHSLDFGPHQYHHSLARSLERKPYITLEHLWSRVGQWLQPGDILLADIGTSLFGTLSRPFPKGVLCFNQLMWGSIGWLVGAALGAALAAQELGKKNRVILFVGDGALQMGVQELLTIARHQLPVYIFVTNNDGYTIERHIHGEFESYNDIQQWKYASLLETFAAEKHESRRVDSSKELDRMFDDTSFAKPSITRLIEVMVPKMDAPQGMRQLFGRV